MDIGLYINAGQQTSYQEAMEQVCLADRLGFSSVWLTEKHFDQGNLLWSSPLIAASYMAARTQRIKIGFAACINTLHHPVRLAEDFANLDVLSNGRLIIGLTRTSLSEYYHDVFQSPIKKSWKKFNEQFEIMCKLWRDNFREKHYGSFYKIPKINLYPLPIQKPLPPIFFVASSDESIIDAAQKGVGIFLHAFQSVRSIQAKKKLYEDYFVDALGLGSRIVLSRFAYVSANRQLAIADIQAPLTRFLNEHIPKIRLALEKEYQTTVDFDFFNREIALFGSATECLYQLKTIQQLTGIEDFVILVNLSTLEHSKSLTSMQYFAQEAFEHCEHMLPTR